MLERLARDKHSNILQKLINYRQIRLITLTPGGSKGPRKV
jgi:hypothetical protein